MSYSTQSENTTSGNRWKCAQCGVELEGNHLPRRSVIHTHHSSEGEQIHSKCKSCGFTLCSSCLSMQKPSEDMADREALCPECGKAFGDGPVLVPAGHAAASIAAEDPVVIETEAEGYAGDLKSWAGWILFWSVINTGSAIYFIYRETQTLGAGEYIMPSGLGGILMIIDLVVFIGTIVCLTQKKPWPGFYIIFAIYLIEIGLLNVTSEGGWRFLGAFQLYLAVRLFINWNKYNRVHQDSGGF